ncbi:RNA-binding protein 45 [Gastrophryne carolinensis]
MASQEDSSGFRPTSRDLDDPPNSRLFLVVSRSLSEDSIRDKFATFGEIQDIWVVRDKQTKESKGIAYIKYAKSSQACRAMEDMHGRYLGESGKPIKVFIAQSRGTSNHRDVEDEELTRIFVMIPKSYTEEDVRNTFKQYGQIEYCSILKNKSTGESKGLGYVRFMKPSQAAMAIENCDRHFKAILAEPKSKNSSSDAADYHSSTSRSHPEPLLQDPVTSVYPYERFDYSSYDKYAETQNQEAISKRLAVVSRVPLIQDQIYSLFDLVPGLEFCEVQRDLYPNYSHAVVQYHSISSAIYAKFKLHGFEYPPGNRLGVSYISDGNDGTDFLRKIASQMVAAQVNSMVWASQQPPQQFPALTPAFDRAFSSPVGSQIQTDASLPACRKKAPSDAHSKERLFVVFSPHPLPLDVAEDVFCRFGNLIDVYLVPGKNIGYVKYADLSSANDAIATLHGKSVNGVKMKVMQAESPRDESNKRQRTY